MRLAPVARAQSEREGGYTAARNTLVSSAEKSRFFSKRAAHHDELTNTGRAIHPHKASQQVGMKSQ